MSSSVCSSAALVRRLWSRAPAAPAAACTNISLRLWKLHLEEEDRGRDVHLLALGLQPLGSVQLSLQVSSRSVHPDLQVLAVLLQLGASSEQTAVSRQRPEGPLRNRPDEQECWWWMKVWRSSYLHAAQQVLQLLDLGQALMEVLRNVRQDGLCLPVAAGGLLDVGLDGVQTLGGGGSGVSVAADLLVKSWGWKTEVRGQRSEDTSRGTAVLSPFRLFREVLRSSKLPWRP